MYVPEKGLDVLFFGVSVIIEEEEVVHDTNVDDEDVVAVTIVFVEP